MDRATAGPRPFSESPGAPARTHSVRREILIVIMLTLLMTLPFVGRPFDMDDIIFLKLAEARQDQPLQLELRDFEFFGVFNESFIDTHPPLVSLYLALMMMLGGSSEVWLHLSFLIFTVTAALAMYFLARRFTRHAMFASLLLVATPGFAVMSHSLMSDLPGLAFWLAATALYVYGLDGRRPLLMVLSSLMLSLGIFTSYQVLGALVLLFVYALLRRRLSLLTTLPLVFPLVLFAGFTAWHLTATGSLPGLSHIHYVQQEALVPAAVLEKMVALICVVGGAIVFPLVLLRVLIIRKRDAAVFALLFMPLFIYEAALLFTGRTGLAEALLIPLFLALGLLCLGNAFLTGGRRLFSASHETRAKGGVLMLWIAGVALAVLFLLPYSSVKYLLPAFPPLVLLFVWMVEDRFDGDRVRKVLLTAVIATAALGALVSLSDYELAASKRFFAEEYAIGYGGEAAGNRLWFSSEFGVRYYMEKQGSRELSERSQVKDGDLVVLPMIAGSRIPAEFEKRLTLVDSISLHSLWPVRVTDHRAGAGFYGSRWGPLPYSLSTGSLDEYHVYRIGS